MPDYEFFDHTADIGLRAFGGDLPELFTNAAWGLFEVITDLRVIEAGLPAHAKTPLKKVSYDLKAKNINGLFILWLREILFSFSSRCLIPLGFKFEHLSEKELKAVARAIVFDPVRHPQKSEVKAVTNHAFKISYEKKHWVAEVVLDI